MVVVVVVAVVVMMMMMMMMTTTKMKAMTIDQAEGVKTADDLLERLLGVKERV